MCLPGSSAWVWSFPLDCGADAEEPLSRWLDPTEARRSSRLSTPELKRGFVISHGLLRLILASFTHRDPRDVHIGNEPFGKPYIIDSGPHFSLSHSGGMGLVAVTWSGPIGVDIEQIRADIEVQPLLIYLLHGTDVDPGEPSAGPVKSTEDHIMESRLFPENRHRCFQIWTRLEAMTKADGTGMRHGASASTHEVRFDIRNLNNLGAGYVGAVATVQKVAQVFFEALPDIPRAISRFSRA